MLRTEPCPRCREMGRDSKGDNLYVYGENDWHCHACGYHRSPGRIWRAPETRTVGMAKLNNVRVEALPHRRISESTCRKFSYKTAEHPSCGPCEIAEYRNAGGEVFSRLIRTLEKKEFRQVGDTNHYALWGRHLWKEGGKHLRITEGQIDAMSVYEVMGDWPVVSVPNGAKTAAEAVRQNLDWVQSFETITLVMDMDEPGREAAQEIAELLPPGKARIAHLRYKDANEYLVNNEREALAKDIWNAKEYRPDGIIASADLDVRQITSASNISRFKWPSLTAKLLGRGQGEIVMVTSGTGMGKSTLVRELMEWDLDQGEAVGAIMLEESCMDTMADLAGLRVNRPIRRALARAQLEEIDSEAAELIPPVQVEDADIRRGFQWVQHKPLYLYDHRGALDSSGLLGKLRYMAVGLGCTKLYLDHITMAVSGNGSGDERQDIEQLMKGLRSLAQDTKVNLTVVCQLSTPDGKPFEEGGQISLRHLRGSRFLGQTADSVVALERNQQADTEEERNRVTVRVLKARRSGWTGIAGYLRYDTTTGRLVEGEATSLSFAPVEDDIPV